MAAAIQCTRRHSDICAYLLDAHHNARQALQPLGLLLGGTISMAVHAVLHAASLLPLGQADHAQDLLA
eukprot:scaffold495519_cov34-Prasinocladus_malaysianus.AAC.1